MRCFVGLSVAGALLSGLVDGGDASAYVVKRTSRGELVHWESDRIEYSLDASIETNVVQGAAATDSAMRSWSGTVGAPDLYLRTGSPDAPTKPGFDQKNGIFFMKGGYEPAGRALAITVLTYDNASGRILDADIVFNGAYTFAVLSPTGTLDTAVHPTRHPTDAISHVDQPRTDADTIYDLHHVVAHEFGHSLGMNDELERTDALMYRYSAPNDATVRTPGNDDIRGLAELYSTKLEARGNGCGGATVSPKKPGLGVSHAALVLSLGLLLFLVARAKRDRRARLGFVLVAATAAVALLPSAKGDGTARADALASGETGEALAVGHARAKVLSTTTSVEQGLLRTTYRVATTGCRAASCPRLATGRAWGGVAGNIRQEVGGWYAPLHGDDVDVSFQKLPSGLAPLASPLGDQAPAEGDVTTLTPAR